MRSVASADILSFYQNQSPDSKGRMLADIWSWDYQKLEYTHDYIQWLFPLKERSRFNLNAPVLNDEVIAVFKTNEQLQANLIKSLKVMLRFYGLQCHKLEDEDIEVTKSEEYQVRKINWIEQGNHNYLRLTRILTSLRLLGVKKYALALLTCLNEIYLEENENIGRETYNYWQNAVND